MGERKSVASHGTLTTAAESGVSQMKVLQHTAEDEATSRCRRNRKKGRSSSIAL